jgi:glycosyltransferase involved in cell wall biosynthesis
VPPLVTIITPTWERHELLLGRCVPSVQAQDYPNLEHVIVSDGPDPALEDAVAALENPRHPVWYFELPEHAPERHWGGPGRREGLKQALGDLIGYVDSDDALRPRHASLLAAALEADPDAGFAYSWMMSHNHPLPGENIVGTGAEPASCNIGTPMIMHRRELADVATWGPPSATEDWEIVSAWLRAGVKFARVEEVTIDVWPSFTRAA